MYAYIENGEIKRFGNLPKVWTLKDGSTVSGFHLFIDRNIEDEEGNIVKTGIELLKEEGWLPVEEVKPDFDQSTEFLTNPQYKILEDKVVKTYTVELIPVVEPVEESNVPTAEERLQALEDAMLFMTLGGM